MTLRRPRRREAGRCAGRPAARPGRGRAGPPDPGGGRHRGRDRRLLRPAARRPRQPAAGGAVARRLPDRLPQLGRLGAQAEGRRAPAEPRGRPCRRPGCAGMRGRRHRLRARTPPARCSSGYGPISGSREATTTAGTCQRPPCSRNWGGVGRHRSLPERPVHHPAAPATLDRADRAAPTMPPTHPDPPRPRPRRFPDRGARLPGRTPGLPRPPGRARRPAALAPLVPLTGAIRRTAAHRRVAAHRRGPVRPPTIAIDLHGRGPASHQTVAALRPGGSSCSAASTRAASPARSGGPESTRWPGGAACARNQASPPTPVTCCWRRPGSAAPGLGTCRAVGRRSCTGRRRAARWPAERSPAVARTARGRRPRRPDHRLRGRTRPGVAGGAAGRAAAASVVLAGQTPLGALAALTASARLVISGDTGMSASGLRLRAPVGDPLRPGPAVRMGTAPASAASGALGGRTRLPRRPARGPGRPSAGRDPAGAVLAAAGRALRAADAAGAGANRSRPGARARWRDGLGLLDGGAITGDVLAMEAGTRVSRARPVAGQA